MTVCDCASPARNAMQELAINCFRYYAGWADKIQVGTLLEL
jgi:hypothetical protein